MQSLCVLVLKYNWNNIINCFYFALGKASYKIILDAKSEEMDSIFLEMEHISYNINIFSMYIKRRKTGVI